MRYMRNMTRVVGIDSLHFTTEYFLRDCIREGLGRRAQTGQAARSASYGLDSADPGTTRTKVVDLVGCLLFNAAGRNLVTRTRSYRRHQAQRWRQRVRRMVLNNFTPVPGADVEAVVNKFYRNRQPNGRCRCCCNRRYWEGPTLQERRVTVDFREISHGKR